MRKSVALVSLLAAFVMLVGCETKEEFFDPPRSYTLAFWDLEMSNVSGSVVVERLGDVSTVSVRLARLEPGQVYTGRINTGTCYGLLLMEVNPMIANEQGRGEAITRNVPTRWSSSAVTDAPPYSGSPFLVYYHGTSETGVACTSFRPVPWNQ